MNLFNLESIQSISPIFVSTKGGVVKIFTTEADQITEISVDEKPVNFKLTSHVEIELDIPSLSAGSKNILFKTDLGSLEKENAFLVIPVVEINEVSATDSIFQKISLSKNEKIEISKAGGSFKIRGSGFEFAKSIKIDETNITNFNKVSDSEINLTTPPLNSGTKKKITITNLANDEFEFGININVKNEPPSITSISPTSKNVNAFATITINGSNFDSDILEVKIEEEVQSIQFSDSSNIVFQYNGSVPGIKDIFVKTTNGTAVLENAFLNFASSRITNILPNTFSQNGGTTVAISGINLDNFLSVSLGGVDCEIIEKTPNLIRILSPATTPGYKTLILAGPIETVTEINIVEAIAEPTINSIYPNNINPAVTQAVTIVGSNLFNISSLQAGQENIQAVSFTPYNDFSGQAIIYANPTESGNQTIQAQSEIGTRITAQNIYTATPQDPIIQYVNPSVVSSSPRSFDFIYSYIIGKNLLPNPSVKIGGKTALVKNTSTWYADINKIDIVYPEGLEGYADVEVSVGSKKGVLTSGIFFAKKPSINKVYPNYSWSGGGQLVTVEGEGLSGCSVFIGQGRYAGDASAVSQFEQALDTIVHSDNKISFFTVPGSGGCAGYYLGNCVDPAGPDGPRILELRGPGGESRYSGLVYLNQPIITNFEKVSGFSNFGEVFTNIYRISGNINDPAGPGPYPPGTWNSFQNTPLKFYPGDSGSFIKPTNIKINGVKMNDFLESGRTEITFKIPYIPYEFSGYEKTLLSRTEVYSQFTETGYSGNAEYNYEGEAQYIENLFFEKVRFMSGVAKILQTGLSGTFSSSAENQSFNQKTSNLFNSFASPSNIFGYTNFNSIVNDLGFRSIINSGLVKYLPYFRSASGNHFTGTSNGIFTGINQDFYDESYPWYYIYTTGNFAQFEAGQVFQVVTTGYKFSGYSENTISSGLSAQILKNSSFINTQEMFNNEPVYIDKNLAYKIWHHKGESTKNYLEDDWYETSYSFDGWNKYGQGNPQPQPAQLKKIKPFEYVKKGIVRLDNGTNYQVGPGFLAGIPDPNVLTFQLPSAAKIGTIIKVEIGSLGYNCTTVITDNSSISIEVDSDGNMFPGTAPARPFAKDKGPFTFLKTKNGWKLIKIGNYPKLPPIPNETNPTWILSPETGDLNFSWIKQIDKFDNGPLGNYIPNPYSNNASGTFNLSISDYSKEGNRLLHGGVIDAPVSLNQVPPDAYKTNCCIQVEYQDNGLKAEFDQQLSSFVPPFIHAIQMRGTGGGAGMVESINYGPFGYFAPKASGVYLGGYEMGISGYFQTVEGPVELYIGENKVSETRLDIIGGIPPYGSRLDHTQAIYFPITGFMFNELGTFDVKVKNILGEYTLPNSFTVFQLPRKGDITVASYIAARPGDSY